MSLEEFFVEQQVPFAAHVKEINGTMIEQSVPEHSLKTATIAKAYGETLGISNLLITTSLLHDVGKLCKDFDDYIRGCTDFVRGDIDHSFPGAKYLYSIACDTKDRSVIETAGLIGRVILSHHGLRDWVDKDGRNYYKDRISKEERYTEVKQYIYQYFDQSKLSELLVLSKEEYCLLKHKIAGISRHDRTSFSFYMGLFERLLLSFLIDADWTDTWYFVSGQSGSDVNQRTWEQKTDLKKDISVVPENENPLSAVWSQIYEDCQKNARTKTGIIHLALPAGQNRMKSALLFGINNCMEQKKDRIFYISASNMNLLEMKKTAKETVGVIDCTCYTESADETMDEYQMEIKDLMPGKWNAPITLLSLLQFLNAFYSDQMRAIRNMHQLSNSVIIIEEPHGIPPKYVSLFNFALNFIASVGHATILLCSAAQPVLDQVKYPLLIEGNLLEKNYMEILGQFQKYKVTPLLKRNGYSYREASDFCLNTCIKEGSVLFVTNTEKAACELSLLLKQSNVPDMEIVHIVADTDLKRTYQCIKNNLAAGIKFICITSVCSDMVSQISFPCIIRSMSGLYETSITAAGIYNRNNCSGRPSLFYLIDLADDLDVKNEFLPSARSISKQIILSGNYPDLLSSHTLQVYSKKFFEENKKNLHFKVKDIGLQSDLVTLLSMNKQRNFGKESCIAQAFQTACSIFRHNRD